MGRDCSVEVWALKGQEPLAGECRGRRSEVLEKEAEPGGGLEAAGAGGLGVRRGKEGH